MNREMATQAVVLASRDHGSINRKVTLLSPELGIIDAICYGSRKSCKAAKANMFLDGRFFLYHDPVKNVYTLKDVSIISSHDQVREDYEDMVISSMICEIAQRTSGGEYRDLYMLVNSALDCICTGADRDAVLIQFILRRIVQIGLLENLDHCPACDGAYRSDEILGFSTSLMVPVHQGCSSDGCDVILPPGARRYLAMSMDMDIYDALDIALGDVAKQRIRGYMVRWITHILGYPLRSNFII